jgi:hypothetical protein
MNNKQLYFIGIGVRMICGTVLLLAAFSKLINIDTYIQAFPLAAFLPREFLTILASGVVALEIIIGIEVISLENKLEIAKIVCFLFSFFLIISVLRLFPSINQTVFPKGCNCFPETVSFIDFSNEVSWHIMRNVVFAVFAYGHFEKVIF